MPSKNCMLLFGKEYFYYLLFCLHFLLCSNTRTRYLSRLRINLPLLPTSTRFAVPVTTSSANSAQLPAHLPVLPQPPLSIRLSPPGLTTVVLFILVSLPLA